MTLTPEQIKEAVELADGFTWSYSGTRRKSGTIRVALTGVYRVDELPQPIIAALASQLISQVDAMNHHSVFEQKNKTEIMDWTNDKNIVQTYIRGSNRDENSILACTEFLREKGDE